MKGFRFAGVQYGEECYCGEEEPPRTRFTRQSECSMPCSGDKEKMCGAGYRMNVYETGKVVTDIITE